MSLSERYNSRPALLREELSMLAEGVLVIVDAFKKIIVTWVFGVL